MTYGDGLSDVDLNALRDFHEKHRRAATVTAIMPQGRFGAVEIDEDDGRVDGFHEKPDGDGRWVNGGFFVLTSAVFDVISGDDCIWEREPMAEARTESTARSLQAPGLLAGDGYSPGERGSGGSVAERKRSLEEMVVRKARTNDVEMPALRERSQSKFLQSGNVTVRQLSDRAAGHSARQKSTILWSSFFVPTAFSCSWTHLNLRMRYSATTAISRPTPTAGWRTRRDTSRKSAARTSSIKIARSSKLPATTATF